MKPAFQAMRFGKGIDDGDCGYENNAKRISAKGRIGFGGTHRAGGGALFGIRFKRTEQ